MKKLLLLLTVFSSLFSFSQENLENKDSTEEQGVPIVIVERAPAFKGCTGDTRQIIACTGLKMRKFVAKHFDVERAKCLKFKMKYHKQLKKKVKVCKEEIQTNRARIKTSFVIDKDGSLTDITAASGFPTLDAEAIRVLKMMPKLEPGEQRGKKVRVRMRLPILFRLQ
ncbi:energy transducer TonB [Pseudotenacibaculum haliotis]|uniref:Energy transducer TonB n=1 Tax=Pseudotenacibaculum haliotis TaxID=1862138 RepID=A0ABW5LPB4_9FLAO